MTFFQRGERENLRFALFSVWGCSDCRLFSMCTCFVGYNSFLYSSTNINSLTLIYEFLLLLSSTNLYSYSHPRTFTFRQPSFCVPALRATILSYTLGHLFLFLFFSTNIYSHAIILFTSIGLLNSSVFIFKEFIGRLNCSSTRWFGSSSSSYYFVYLWCLFRKVHL